ncbi:hypothetical protein SteCoe_7587 [Stentor coeruleus]|uniref:PH domain-containing protein n=1 Tax=Stentor coeruleus TaxID=5963 RepID=A0A1R2CMD1_9CILI|nr:hypothetical protein SteCoe_7587 [Stentor coeruleus]
MASSLREYTHNSCESSIFSDIFTPIDAFEETPQELPSIQGWLEKKTTGLIHRWVRRYFSLKNHELKYFYNDQLDKLGGVINFDIITIDVQISKKKFKLIILGGKRSFQLRASSKKEALDWVYAISLHINNSCGRKKVTAIALKKRFWKFSRISQDDFQTMACTGDLLLFQGKDTVSKMQRLVTNSKYDHVAIILKYSSGRVALFEATGENGVSIVFWDDFTLNQWEKLYSKLVYRRLDFDRSERALKGLEEFIYSVEGKKYKITARTLMSSRKDEDPKKKKGFFCSELVAMAYKMMYILPDNPPASKYWPGDFADSKNLKLINGACLQPGMLIDFDIK